ncbi:DM7 family protein GE17491-like [Drosophila teissieri]|uniref:DM7 family protein GE17491-like n=1 Tax=Drosophila teissieri TaxID=7243 RepID=UPI001CB9DF42|nr:DM7 family protein GE17491-like [Drosophila teissieri]
MAECKWHTDVDVGWMSTARKSGANIEICLNSTNSRQSKMQQMESVHRDENQVVVLKKTTYLPYLFNLVMPKMVYQSPNRIVVARLYLDVHKHDKQAADYFEGFQTPCFEVPASLFPGEAPLDKIVFMPKVILPMGFEAGGVFGPGVLPRRSYPIGLMASDPKDHKGQTPPLFVGLRSLHVKLPSEVESYLDSVGEFPAIQDAVVNGMHPGNHSSKGEESKELMLSNDCPLSMVYNMPAPPSPLQPYPYLSIVTHPHVPAEALATMGDEECPNFELLSDIFPICEGVNPHKSFLPQRFESLCVFKPGSHWDLWYMDYMRRFRAFKAPHFAGKFPRVGVPVHITKKIQLEGEKEDCEGAQSLPEEGSLKVVEPKRALVPTTQGFLVMETEHPTPPRGAYSLASYQRASEKGYVLKATKDEAKEATDTLPKVESKPEVEKKYLSCFKVDSDIDLMAEAMADMGTAEMSLVAKEEALPGVDSARALDQLRQVLEDRSQIRSHTDQLIQDHIYRMDRNRMLALRQPIRTCSQCGKPH